VTLTCFMPVMFTGACFTGCQRFFRCLLFAAASLLVSGCGTGIHYRAGVSAGYPSPYYRYDYYPYGYFHGFGVYPYKYRRPYGYYGPRYYGFDRHRRPHYWDGRPYRYDKPFRHYEGPRHRFDKPFRYHDRRSFRPRDHFPHWERRPYGSGKPFQGPWPRGRYRR
jgi:hypothetical protein